QASAAASTTRVSYDCKPSGAKQPWPREALSNGATELGPVRRCGDFGRLPFAAKVLDSAGTRDIIESRGQLGGRGSRVGSHPRNHDAERRTFPELAFDTDFAAQ